ncbi:YqgE/AlgH family protein [Aestuariispira ectoiniformans]|uniref:YqgE/AlgH family protein n=1 Tax=Aestuariispira ectoiniformans TaxID=2775080 RepID=UPI00223B6447|nr:YqgE/AlgH family protein [Aestuariispira ectoiniformans]
MTLGPTDMRSGYLAGQLLVAMPSMTDPRFEKSVIYVCVHNSDGAMGLVINRLIETLTFSELLEQLGLPSPATSDDILVHFGGPVESGRGFVLHSPDYSRDGTVLMDSGVGLTATVDILRDISQGFGPRESLLALGYAGWGPGQLDGEIQENAWLHCQPDEELVFDHDLGSKWQRAITKIGIDLSLLSGEAGHA